MDYETMKNYYLENSKSEKFILGFYTQSGIYMLIVPCEENVLDEISNFERASGGNCYKTRGNTQRTDVVRIYLASLKKARKLASQYNSELIYLCSQNAFDYNAKQFKYNKGYYFESLVCDYFGLDWEYTKQDIQGLFLSDITVNGINYQIKFNKATLISSSQIR